VTHVVWKYPLEITGVQTLRLPGGARVLSVVDQNETLTLYAWVDSEAPLRPRKIYVYGTGHFCPPTGAAFLGTVLLRGGSLAWHVFVGPEEGS
jgi:hypothetical protein